MCRPKYGYNRDVHAGLSILLDILLSGLELPSHDNLCPLATMHSRSCKMSAVEDSNLILHAISYTDMH